MRPESERPSDEASDDPAEGLPSRISDSMADHYSPAVNSPPNLDHSNPGTGHPNLPQSSNVQFYSAYSRLPSESGGCSNEASNSQSDELPSEMSDSEADNSRHEINSIPIVNRSNTLPGERGPPQQQDPISITDFLNNLNARQNTTLHMHARRLDSRGWRLHDLEQLPRSYLEERGLDDEEIDALLHAVAAYFIGRTHGHIGI